MRTGMLAIVVVLTTGYVPASGQPIEVPLEIIRNGAPTPRPEDAETAEILEAQKRPHVVWARAEVLLWWIRPANFPPLVTRGDVADGTTGALGSPGTIVDYGRGGMDYQDRAGGRFTVGWWLDEEHYQGIEGGYFFLRGRTLGQGFTSVGNPVLARPFFNVNTGKEDALLVAYPGINSGSVVVDSPSFLQGTELHLSTELARREGGRIRILTGFRWLHLNEALNIHSRSLVDVAPQFAGLGIPYDGNTIEVRDGFEARTNFYGGQIGARTELTHKRFTLELLGKVALGVSHEVVKIHGFTSIDTTPATAVSAGLLALSSNSGRHATGAFAVVPEANMTLKFRLTENIDVFAGYSFLYWSRVARPADQIDPGVNVNLVPTSGSFGAGGAARPTFDFRHSDFFAHGANFGVEVRY